MELPDIQSVSTQSLDQWYSNVTDIINYNSMQIQTAVPALDKKLTNLDPAPTQDIKSSMDDLSKSINKGFDLINKQFNSLDSRLKMLEAK